MNLTTRRTEGTTWKDIAALVAAGSLKVGDQIEDELLNGEKMVYEVAHITEDRMDFISRDTMAERFTWNENGRNTGGFKKSDLCKALNEKVWEKLPEELKAVICERECIQVVDGEEEKFMLKLWLPSEYEVFGEEWFSDAKEGEQLEIFKDPRNRIKMGGHGGSRASWWLLSVNGGHSTTACLVVSNGDANSHNCARGFRVPLCFSIKR